MTPSVNQEGNTRIDLTYWEFANYWAPDIVKQFRRHYGIGLLAHLKGKWLGISPFPTPKEDVKE